MKRIQSHYRTLLTLLIALVFLGLTAVAAHAAPGRPGFPPPWKPEKGSVYTRDPAVTHFVKEIDPLPHMENFPKADIRGPAPQLGEFDDFEDPAWLEEIHAIYKTHTSLQRHMALMNAALQGNALASFIVADYNFFDPEYPPKDIPPLPQELFPLWERTQWMDHADSLTSKGWWHLRKQLQTPEWQRDSATAYYRAAIMQGHPMAMYAIAREKKLFGKTYMTLGATQADVVHESARLGYGQAQSDLATAYFSPGLFKDWINDDMEAKNDSKSESYGEAAARQGEPGGLNHLANRYFDGRGEYPEDHKRAAMYSYAELVILDEKLYSNILTRQELFPDHLKHARSVCNTIIAFSKVTAAENEEAKELGRQLADAIRERYNARREAKLADRKRICAEKLQSIEPLYRNFYAWAKEQGISLPPPIIPLEE